MLVAEVDNNAKIEHMKGRWIMRMDASADTDIVGVAIAIATEWIV